MVEAAGRFGAVHGAAIDRRKTAQAAGASSTTASRISMPASCARRSLAATASV
jgi:hypothetical protein